VTQEGGKAAQEGDKMTQEGEKQSRRRESDPEGGGEAILEGKWHHSLPSFFCALCITCAYVKIFEESYLSII